MLSAGDMTGFGYDFEFCDFFENMDSRPLIAAMGNHDIRVNYWKQIIQRSDNSYLKVGDLGIYIINIMEQYSVANINANPTTEKIDRAIKFLYDNANRTARHKIILNHYPYFSFEGSANQYF